VVEVEPTDWPDACLGVHVAGRVCAQRVTPGYRILLEYNDSEYEFHTDELGMNVILAQAPEPEIGLPVLSWQGNEEPCLAGQLGGQGVAYGSCGGAFLGNEYANPDRQEELTTFREAYKPFSADTPAGTITLDGLGSKEASPVEQRAIAEWARSVIAEAASQSNDSFGRVLVWHREGGIAGFCDDVRLDTSGILYASSCKGNAPQETKRMFLNSSQLQQLYTFNDRYKAFEYTFSDSAVADKMTTELFFYGKGEEEVGPQQRDAILQLVQALYTNLR